VHHRVHSWRQRSSGGDPVPVVADSIASESTLLCFDEFQVVDVADALILRRLFEILFHHGCVMVATSNRAPEQLYENGLNRPLFLPFIDLLKERCEVLALDEGHGPSRDYRQRHADFVPQVYNHPLSSLSEQVLDRWTERLGGHKLSQGGEATLSVGGRPMHVPFALDDVCRFSFAELCGRPLGAEDYIALCARYHTVILSGVPRLTPLEHNEAKRFITLVDVLYERNIGFVCSAAVPLNELFATLTGAEGSSNNPDSDPFSLAAQSSGMNDIRFAYHRAVSRITEMQSKEFWNKHYELHVEAKRNLKSS